MSEGLQTLTEKLYREGVERGELEAKEIIAKATREATDLVDNARQRADEMLESARQEIADLHKKSENEMRMAMRQAMDHLKDQITNAITARIINPAVEIPFHDPEFLKSLLLTIAQNLRLGGESAETLRAILPKNKYKEFRERILGRSINLLSEGIEVQFSDQVQTGFTIGPVDGHYRISFSEKDFELFFKEYLKPRTARLLFGPENER